MKLTTILGLTIATCNFTFAQSTLILQPDANAGKDALINSATPSTNYSTHEEVSTYYWTNQGSWTTGRSLLQFDLSQLPSNAVITNATLSLWCNTTTMSTQQLHSGANNSTLRRITGAWTEAGVNWNNQPSTTSQNQVSLPASTSQTEDYLNIDVTALYQDIFGSTNYGVMLSLDVEDTYKSLVFASSDYTNAAKRPKLVITYVTDNCVTIQPDAASGKDALINSATPSTNFATHEEVSTYYWTNQGSWTTGRSLMQFNLSQVPSNAIITSAQLSLWCNTTTQSTTQLHSGQNDSYIRRITGAWTESSVNWSNQPSTTSVNQVSLPASSSQTQDYLNIDVTQLYTDIWNGTDYGIMLTLNTEDTYKSLVFASSDYTNAAKRPKLEVCYEFPSHVAEKEKVSGLNVYPNPVNDLLNITWYGNQKIESISLLSTLGQEVIAINNLVASGSHFQLSTTGLPAGNYFLKIKTANEVQTSIVVVQ